MENKNMHCVALQKPYRSWQCRLQLERYMLFMLKFDCNYQGEFV
jgi:hypothetical protein